MCLSQELDDRKTYGEIQISTYPGRIIVTEPKGMVQPRINVEKHSMRHVVLNGQTTLPCIAQGHPVPTYRSNLQRFNFPDEN
uniref:Uncharacterized protein n=1 Tax=Glossina palpalis gambiensis TaxID=67801 RepID=A0A1B0B434_9MUSC